MEVENIKRAGVISRLLDGLAKAKEQAPGFTGVETPDCELILRCESSLVTLNLSDLISRHRFRALIEEELADLESTLIEETKRL